MLETWIKKKYFFEYIFKVLFEFFLYVLEN